MVIFVFTFQQKFAHNCRRTLYTGIAHLVFQGMQITPCLLRCASAIAHHHIHIPKKWS